MSQMKWHVTSKKEHRQRKQNLIHVLMTRTDESQNGSFFTELLHIIESEIHGQNLSLSNVVNKQTILFR